MIESLLQLEALVYRNDKASALPQLVNFFRQFDKTVSQDSILLTRLVSCLFHILLDKEAILSSEQFYELLKSASIFKSIIAASGFVDSSLLCEHLKLALETGEKEPQQQEQLVMRLLLAYNLSTTNEVNLLNYLKPYPRLVSAGIIGFLSSKVIISERSGFRRENLLDNLETIAGIPQKYLPFEQLASVWRLTSFANRRDKHKFKYALNQMITSWLASQNVTIIEACHAATEADEKPKLLIPLERRLIEEEGLAYYRAIFEVLAQKYHLLFLHDEERLDELFAFDYDSIHYPNELEHPECLQNLIDTILDHRLEAIYYPSVGHDWRVILLANTRLAPVQLYTLWHAASTCSAHMDYVIGVKEVFSPFAKDLYNETLLLLPDDTFSYRPSSRVTHYEYNKTAVNKKVVDLLVVARTEAINAIFLNSCEAIDYQSERNITFTFLLDEQGAYFNEAKAEILRLLPTASVVSMSEQGAYDNCLKNSDVLLATFPYSNARIAYDAAYYALPFICLEGEEFFSRTDAHLLRLLQMPNWLITHGHSDYVQAAVRLIEKDHLRLTVSETLHRNYHEFINTHTVVPEQFGELIDIVLEKHEQIKQRNQKNFTLAQLRRLKENL